ncbi:MAG: C4-type zinc ribbon domain-containing protein [Clostridiaceae bacterium]|jgi:predicted  nucleic acid-binding Zn-ribbon protein|nr:C4-type zinc ribbon domain-containing protein [Clostridiaceae bacterium]
MNLPLLYELQDLHKGMNDIGKKLKELQEVKDLRKLKEEYQRLREEYIKGEEKLKKNTYQQETRNNEIKNLDFNKKASEEIKFSRETNTIKKLENIEKQLEKLEEKKQGAENDIIELINEAENINKELAETKKKLAFIKKKYMNVKEAADKAAEKLEVQKTELQAKIDDMMKAADKESLEIYGRLIKTHADPVAMVENRICSGCKMEVPAMDYEALKSGSQELRCQSCGRILFYRKH